MHVRGYIDGIFGAAVRGWVVDLDDPTTPLLVVVRFDGHQFPGVTADEPRADLARAGIGAGLGGFRIQLGGPPAAGSHDLVAVVAGTTTRIPLAKDLRLLDATDSPRSDIELYESQVEEPAPAARATAATGVHNPASGEAALAGEAGWLFRCPAHGFDLLRGVADPAPAAVNRLADQAERFTIAAAERGAACFIVVLPDKLHVYPEQAPSGMELYSAGRIAEHWAAHIQDLNDVLLVDLLGTLVRARAHGRVFSRAGAGPTWIGAFHGYREVAKHVAFAVPPLRPHSTDELVLGPDEPVWDAPRDGVLLRWQDGALVPDGTTVGLATTAVEPSMLLPGVGEAHDGDRAAQALIVHDTSSRRIAELLATHVPTTLVARDVAEPADLDDLEPLVAVWLVADHTLARLASTR